MYKPKASIIIPTYNSSKFIEKTIKSLVQKNETAYEIIVIDDCSEDVKETKKILNKYERIKLITKNKKTNAAHSRNIGYQLACGDIVFFLDSDDYFDENHIKKRIKLHTVNDIDIIFGAFKNEGCITPVFPEWHGEDFRDYIFLRGGDIRSSTISINKSKNLHFVPFDSRSRKHQDWIFAIKNQFEKKFFFDSFPSVNLVSRENSMSSKQNTNHTNYFIKSYELKKVHINNLCFKHIVPSVKNNDKVALSFFVSNVKITSTSIKKIFLCLTIKYIPGKNTKLLICKSFIFLKNKLYASTK